MSVPVERQWMGESMLVVLRDEEGSGILGMARETTLRLTQHKLQLVGKRLGGLNVEIPLTQVREVKPRLYPQLTLDVTGMRGRVEIPAAAHAFEDLQVLAEEIMKTVHLYQGMLNDATTGAAGDALRDLQKLIDES